MKSIWNGSISFGLVSIPVRLYASAQEHVLGFRMLHKKCNTPLELKRWCPHCKQEVTWENVVKGIQLERGKYFVLTQDAIAKLKPQKTDTIVIDSFVDKEMVDRVYYNTHYYMAPEKVQRSFTLFQHALGASNKVAIGTFVMRDREHTCMIESYHEGLLLTTLYYSYEIRPVENLAIFQEKQPTIASNELKLARELIGQMTHKTINLAKFKDTFAQELKKRIKQKAAGKLIELEETKKTRKRKKEKEETLSDILKASLHEKHARR